MEPSETVDAQPALGVVQYQGQEIERAPNRFFQCPGSEHREAQQFETTMTHGMAVEPEQFVIQSARHDMPQNTIMRRRYPGIGQFEQIRRNPGATQHGFHIQPTLRSAINGFLHKTDRYRIFVHGFFRRLINASCKNFQTIWRIFAWRITQALS
jgi:hypothetical protein